MASPPEPDKTAEQRPRPAGAPGAAAAASSSNSPTRPPHLHIPESDDHPLSQHGRRGKRSVSDLGKRRVSPSVGAGPGSGSGSGSGVISPAASPGLERSPYSAAAGAPRAPGAGSSADANANGPGTGGFTSPDADLLGIGPSRPRRRERDTATGTSSRDSPQRPRASSSYHALDSLGRDEIALLDARFEDMADADIATFLAPYEKGWDVYRVKRAEQEAEEARLFPPSPPGERRDHPLKVLSRAVRELREVAGRLEEENARLRLQVDEKERERLPSSRRGSEPVPLPVVNERQHTHQLSIHDSLADALSTSMTSPARGALALALVPERSGSVSPSPSLHARPKSPAPSHTSVRSSKSVRSTMTVDRPRGTSASGADLASPTARKGWSGMSIWGWKRPGRKGSSASLAGSVATGNYTVEEEEDDSWRRGDGGSTPAFRAIFLATRILTPDPASILVKVSGSLVAQLAHTLVSNARDQDISPREPAGRARARSRAASVGSQQAPPSTQGGTPASADQGQGYGDQAIAATVAVGRTLLKHGKAAIEGLGTEGAPGRPSPRPALLNRASSRPFPTTAMAPALPSPDHSPGTKSPSADTPPPSVELSSIVPDESRPPTVLLSRQNLGSFFQSSRAKLTTATRFTSDQPPLTDRYGFIYDIQHANMLKDASRVGTPAPMSLTGHIPEPPKSKPTPPPQTAAPKPRRAAALPSSLNVPIMDHTPARRPTLPTKKSETKLPSSSLSPNRSPGSVTPPNGTTSRTSDTPGRQRTRSYAPAPAKPIAAAEQLTVSVRGATGAQTGETSSIGSPASGVAVLSQEDGIQKDSAAAVAASRLTVSSLLDQLTDIHDRQQKARTADWDAFLRKRTRARRGTNGREREQDVGVGGALAQVAALAGTAKGAEEYKAFLRLVRKGIPMPYRGDVWAECSGARDLLVPGEYAEILAVHKDDQSAVMTEIEKDVGRTFPGNVFFGGDGPGVAKLRRVLTAYSWHNPAVGYCQGMNMLAATLLLTYTDEAFWVLHCIIERLLPADYYAPSLLGSRADQLVLADLVTQHLPRIANHLTSLGVDLTALTFGWFLSLFTDCLPVETLFRVWDVLFVEGHDVLFRVAIAILKLNEAEICGCESVGDLFGAISGMTSRLWSADKLVALQHSFKQAIRRNDVQALMDKHAGALQGEMDD